MRITLTTALSLLFLYSTTAWSQNLTSQQAVDESKNSSPQLQKAKAVQEEIAWKKTEALNTFLPAVTAQATYLFDKKYMLTDISIAPGQPAVPIAAVVPNSMATLTATLPLFEGGAGLKRYSSAGSLASAAEMDYHWADFQLGREVVLQFYKTLAAKDLLQVAQQNLKTLQDHHKDVSLFKKAGVSTNYDLLRVEVQVSEAESELLNATDNFALARGKLSEIMGEDVDTRELVGTWPEFSVKHAENLEPETLNSLRDLQALQLRAEGTKSLAGAASSYWIPKLALYGQYQYYNNRTTNYDDWGNYREAYQTGLTLTWNLFDGMTSIARDHQAFQQSIQSEKGLAQSRRKAKQDLDFWKRKYLYYGTVFKTRKNDVAKSEESVRLARQGKRFGTRTDTDLLDAEAELFRARAGLVNAQMGALESLVNLELTTGKNLLSVN